MRKGAFLICFMIMALTPLWAKEVNVILLDKTLVQGELLGLDEQTVYLQGEDNKARNIPLNQVAQIFDAATGEKINTSKPQPPLIPVSAAPVTSPAESTTPTKTETVQKQTLLYFYGTMQSGTTGGMPCEPLGETYVYTPDAPYFDSSMKPYDSSWGAGLSLEWRMASFLSFNLDAGYSSWDKLLAKKDGYGASFWVWEQRGYTDASIGPFPMDVRYYMDTTSFKLGTKYYVLTGMFQPWLGVSAGMYAWKATVGNREEEKEYGDTSGMAYATSFQVGVDLVMDDFVLRLFGDFGTAVANPSFENLFHDGWTFEDPGGEFVEGPYRYGIAIGMSM